MSDIIEIDDLEQKYLDEKDIFKKMEIRDKINELKGKEISCDFENPDCETCSG